MKKNLFLLLVLSTVYLNHSFAQTVTRPYSVPKYTSIFMSSPVQGQNIGDTYTQSPGSGNLPPVAYGQYYFNATTQQWVSIPASTVMIPGVGYVETSGGTGGFGSIGSPEQYPQIYNGTINDGNITVPIVGGNKPNLIGNPYKDFLDADLFLLDPDNVNVISGPLTLWSHSSVASSSTTGGAQYNFTGNDYALYNVLGGVSAGRAVTSSAGATNTANPLIPNGKIYLGTGFWINGINSGGQATFKNSMRSTSEEVQLFRTNVQTTSTSLITPPSRHRIWVNLEQGVLPSNSSTPFRQTLVGYADGATSGDNDRVFDAQARGDNPQLKIDLYSYAPNSTKKLAIQGKDLNTFVSTDFFDLGVKIAATEAGSNPYTFTALADGMFDGSGGSQLYFIQDLSEPSGQNIFSFPYEVILSPGTYEGRFRIIFDAPYTTKLSAVNCGRVFLRGGNSFNKPIQRITTNTDRLHRWRFKNLTTNQFGYIETNSTSVKLSDIVDFDDTAPFPNFFVTHNTTYEIDIATLVGGQWLYGQKCTVSTAEMTVTNNVGVNICNTIFPQTGQVKQITCTPSAPYSYNWTIKRIIDGQTASFSSGSNNHFQFQTYGSSFFNQGFLVANTEYSIQVQVIYANGVLGEFSEACNITTGSTAPRLFNGNSDFFNVTPFPNPFTNDFFLDVKSESREDIIIKVYNILGNQIETKLISYQNSGEKITLGTNYASGVYNVIVLQGENRKNLKLIKK